MEAEPRKSGIEQNTNDVTVHRKYSLIKFGNAEKGSVQLEDKRSFAPLGSVRRHAFVFSLLL